MNAQANERSENRAYEQAQAQANSIAAMVAALNVDYDRLEELRDELNSLEYDVESAEEGGRDHDEAVKALVEWRAEYTEELKELEEAANGCEDEDEARERIQEDALDVQVRSDWHHPGSSEDNQPSEFMILLCTGGPAVRIMGELRYGEPFHAWIEYQDWFKPWAEAPGIIDQDTLLQYCRQFWFGE